MKTNITSAVSNFNSQIHKFHLIVNKESSRLKIAVPRNS